MDSAKLEIWSCLISGVLFGGIAFPGYTAADVGGILSGVAFTVGDVMMMLWIKNDGGQNW